MTRIVCTKCRSDIPSGAPVCPRCGAPAPKRTRNIPRLTAFPTLSNLGRSEGMRTWLIFAPVLLILLILIAALTYSLVNEQLSIHRAGRVFIADSRELLLREQQRLNSPEADTLAKPPYALTTPLGPARNRKELMQGLRLITEEVGSKSRYRQAQAQAQIAALHLEDLLLPENLLGAEGLRSGREANRRYVGLINYSTAIRQASQKELEQRLRRLAGELPEGRAVMADFTRNAALRQEEEIALLNNQRATIGKIDRIFDLAQARMGHIDLDDGKLMFEDPKDADQYNRLVADIHALAAHREAIHRQQQARMQTALQAIAKLKSR